MFGFGGLGGGTASHGKDRRLLTVEVVNCKGIIGVNNRGRESDSFVRVELVSASGKKTKEQFKTYTVPKLLNPEFKQVFEVGKFFDMENCNDFVLHFEVCNKSAFSISETPLGCTDIDLMTIDADGAVEERDYPLELSGRMKNVTGTIRIRTQFNQPVGMHDIHAIGEDVGEGSPLMDLEAGGTVAERELLKGGSRQSVR